MGFFDIILWSAAITAGVTLSILLIAAAARKKLRNSAADWLLSEGLTTYKEIFAPGDAIGIDYERELIAIAVGDTKQTINFKNLISIETAEDGKTVNKVNRGSQVLGAAVGATAFGGVGAIVGGLSGTSHSTAMVKRASINIITDLPDTPFLQIKVYDGQEIKKDGFLYKQIVSQIMPWFARLKAIVENR